MKILSETPVSEAQKDALMLFLESNALSPVIVLYGVEDNGVDSLKEAQKRLSHDPDAVEKEPEPTGEELKERMVSLIDTSWRGEFPVPVNGYSGKRHATAYPEQTRYGRAYVARMTLKKFREVARDVIHPRSTARWIIDDVTVTPSENEKAAVARAKEAERLRDEAEAAKDAAVQEMQKAKSDRDHMTKVLEEKAEQAAEKTEKKPRGFARKDKKREETEGDYEGVHYRKLRKEALERGTIPEDLIHDATNRADLITLLQKDDDGKSFVNN